MDTNKSISEQEFINLDKNPTSLPTKLKIDDLAGLHFTENMSGITCRVVAIHLCQTKHEGVVRVKYDLDLWLDADQEDPERTRIHNIDSKFIEKIG